VSAMSDYLEGLLGNLILRTQVATKPAGVYVSLHTGDPGETGGSEVSGGNYARVQVDQLDANWNAPAGGNGVFSNVNAITFPAPNANWGACTHFGIYDQSSGGNLLFHGALTTPKTVNNGDPAPSFAAGALVITLA
jgi:hypothetical protein